MKSLRVYVAGALSSKEKTDRDPSRVVSDYIQNVSAMCKAASAVRRKGHYPYVPGLDFLLGVVVGDWKEEDYREIGKSFLEVCEAILVISESWGVQKEINRAKELGIPIYYRVEDISDGV